ncbi:MAG: hypothetical protein QOJ94_118 [Sphingomonadales bacterium]|jgi:hypothetical protein|nr:hypothetical protein [Sphingomonadales bacterium]
MQQDHRNSLANVRLDSLGRVQLSDELLEQIEELSCELSAGGENLNCPTTNGGCTNIICNDSVNFWCTNEVQCYTVWNFGCNSPRDVDGG